jgi:hypothetical protein
LGFGPGLEETGHVEPDVEPDWRNRGNHDFLL